MPDSRNSRAEVGSYECPADERVWSPNRTMVVAARGPFGIVRAVQVGSYHVGSSADALKEEIAKHVGKMTEGVYWSQHVYDGAAWYATSEKAKDARAAYNGVWLWKWADPPQGVAYPDHYRWDWRCPYYGDGGRWIANTVSEPIKLADLPKGM